MKSHRAVRRSLVLASAAAVMALSLPVGNPVATAPVRAAGPVYPQIASTGFYEGPRSISVSATAGVVSLVPNAVSPDVPPTPAGVIAKAGPGPIQSAAILRADLTQSPLASTSLVSLHLEKLPIDIPLSTIPIIRTSAPTSWQDLLAGTILKDVPLVAVTWKDIATLAPTGLGDLSMADVDWSNSALADLPLAALTFGGADITTVMIPLQPGEPDDAANDSPAERWCYLLDHLETGRCDDPSDLAGKTLLSISVEGAPLKNIPLKNIPLKNISLDASPLKNIPLKNIALASSPLKNIPLKNIDLQNSPLKNIPLKNIDFGFAPLKNIPLKNITLATSPLKNIPLKNIDFTVAPLKNIPLKNIDLSSSPLKNIPLKNIALAGAPLKNIPLKNIAWGTAPLKNIPLKNIDLNAATSIGAIPLAALNMGAIPLGSRAASDFAAGLFATAPAAGATLAQVAAASGFAAGATVKTLNAARTAGADITLGDLRLDVALPSAPAISLEQLLNSLLAAAGSPTLGDLAPGTVVSNPTLGDLRLDLLADTGITVGNLLAVLLAAQPDVVLGDLRIDLMTAVNAPALTLADFIGSLAATTADGVTLGDLRLDLATGIDALVLDALSGFLLVPNTFDAYLLGALTTYTDVTGHDITLGELGTWTLDPGGDITLGQIAQYLDDTVTLADVLLGLVPASDFPFENFPISSLGLDQPGRSIFHSPAADGEAVTLSPQNDLGIVVFIKSDADATAPALLHITGPAGTTFDGMVNSSVSNPVQSIDPDGRVRVTANLAALPANTQIGVQVFWSPGIDLGPDQLVFGISAPDGTPVGTDLAQSFPDLIDGAEPNSTADGGFVRLRMPQLRGNLAANPMYDSLISGYISTDHDVDWYQLNGVPAGSRITADLTNLPVDADLVLYGPSGLDISPTLFPSSQQGLPGALVEDPGLGVGTVAKQLAVQALADLRLDQGYRDTHAPRTPENVDTWPPLVKLTPLSISQHRGTDAESVGYIAPVTGDYVVAVSGYNGTTSNNPYLLRVRATKPPAATTCAARTFAYPFGDIATTPTAPSGSTALILTAPNRIHATYGDDGTGAIDTEMQDLTTYLQAHTDQAVPGIVDLYSYPAVKAAYDAWDAKPCSVDLVNEVVRQITKVINDLRTANPDLAYITIVGGDDIIPMGRVVDLTRVSNEAEYAETFGDDHNPISAAEAGGYTLTDDPYGDTSPTDIGNGSSLFIPRLAVGRLVESPTEIAAQLKSFVDHVGVLDTHTGLVAGYDFLADGAKAVADRLAAPGRSIDSSLIDDYGATTPWSGTDLLGKLFPAGSADPLIDSINAHYDHNALQPSKQDAPIVQSTDLVDAGKVLDAPNRLAGRLLFTMGCHAGLAVPDSYLSAADAALGVDWAQTLSAAGVSVYVANTGYGIGDTASVAYTEKLMGLYAKLLDGSLTAGRALAYAKQAYYGSLGAVGVYDTKILEQTTFYGLPFWSLTVTSGNGRYGSTGSTSALVIPPALTVPTTADANGLATLDTTVTSSFEQVDVAGRGSYWVVKHDAGNETPFTAQDRPIQPQTVLGVGGTSLVPHGVMVTSLTQLTDKANVNPVLASLSADQATATAEVHADQAGWPARMAVINRFESPTGNQADLVLVPGQFIGATDGTGAQRLFDNVGVRVYYADATHDTDFSAPEVSHGRGIGHGNEIDFSVNVGTADATAVRVGFRDFDGTWKFLDLAGSGDTWSGTFTGLSHAFGATDYLPWFAQAVDGAGNVGTGSGKALGFVATSNDTTPPVLTFSISPAPDASGVITANLATVTFHCSDTESGVDPVDCPESEMVTAQGKTEVHAHVLDRAGNETIAVATVRLDSSRPVITASVTPPDWANAPSGTATFTCRAGSAPLVGTCPAPVTVTTPGDTPVTRSVTDSLGRTASVTAHIRLDPTAPTITARVTPAPNAAGWNRDSTVTVSFTCADTYSGIPAGTCPADQTFVADNVYQVHGQVFDAAGNGASVDLTVYRDRTSPTVGSTQVGGTIHACTTTDALSGVASSATGSSVTTRVNGLPTTVLTCSSATDVAGNTGAGITDTYVAPITFGGFLAPVDGPPVVNNGTAGKTYPLKFKLTGIDGQPIAVLAAIPSVTYKAVSCSSLSGTSDDLPAGTAGNSAWSVDTTTNTFQYQWKTPSAKGCYTLSLSLADGSARTAYFNLK